LHWPFVTTHTHTHTHPFNGPFSRTTRVSRYQKGKTNLDFTEARDSEWRWHQLGHIQVCNSLQTDNHARPHHCFFTGQMPFLSPSQQRQSSEGTICHSFSGYSPIGLIGLVGPSDLVSGMSTLPVVGGILSVLLYVYLLPLLYGR